MQSHFLPHRFAMNRISAYSLITIALLSNGIGSVRAADRMLIINDQNAAALKGVFDAAIRANGLSQVSRNAMIFSDMLDQAGVVTKTEEVPPAPTAPVAPESKKDNGP